MRREGEQQSVHNGEVYEPLKSKGVAEADITAAGTGACNATASIKIRLDQKIRQETMSGAHREASHSAVKCAHNLDAKGPESSRRERSCSPGNKGRKKIGEGPEQQCMHEFTSSEVENFTSFSDVSPTSKAKKGKGKTCAIM